MGRLEYDDSAFAYFGLVVLLFFAVPYTYYFIRSSFYSKSSGEQTGIDQLTVSGLKSHLKANKNFTPRSKLESFKLQQALAQASPMDGLLALLNVKATFKTIVLVVLWSLIINFAKHCANEQTQIQQFDPYEILGLGHEATEQEIRKKYRRMSVEWHPDQWVSKGEEERLKAEAMFIKISKASAALTDEVSRENYKKYGNPDGPQPMELSLGLPSFLLDKKNQNVVLLVYIIVLVVFIPTAVFVYYSNSKRYSDKFILNESYQVYAYFLNPAITMKHIVEVLSLSAEFRSTVPATVENDNLFNKLKKILLHHDMISKKPMPTASNLFDKWPSSAQVNLLLHAHFNRIIPLFPSNDELTNLQPEILLSADAPGSSFSNAELVHLRQLLDGVLVKCPMLLDAMQEVATMRRSLKLINKISSLRGGLIQAIHPHAPNPLFMVSGFDRDQALAKKVFARGFSTFDAMKKLSDAEATNLKIPPEIMKATSLVLDPKNGIRSPEMFCQIGCLEYEDKKTGRVFFDNKFGVQDVVTVYIVLNFTGESYSEDPSEKAKVDRFGEVILGNDDPALQNDERIAFAPFFPVFVKESFNITLGAGKNEEMLLGALDIVVDKSVVRKKLMFKPDFQKPGEYEFDVYLTSKTYVGMDQKQTLKLKVLSQEEIDEIEVHPEDLETEKTPGIFDVFESLVKDEDSDFEDDDKGSKETKQPVTAQKKESSISQKRASTDIAVKEQKGTEINKSKTDSIDEPEIVDLTDD